MAQDIVGSKMPDSAAQQLKAPADNKKTGYGANGYRGASSDTDLSNPTQSAIAQAMLQCDLDAAKHPDLQKRTLAPGNVPVNSGTKGASAGPKIPGALIDNATDPVRKP